MSLHPSLAQDSPECRRLRWWAPLLLVVVLTALALAPGRIAGDRPFQAGLCGDLEQAPAGCAQPTRTVLAAMQKGITELAGPARPVR